MIEVGKAMKKAAVIIISALLIFPPGVHGDTVTAAGDAGFVALEARVIDSFYRGDLYSLYNSIEELLIKYPARPESILYYYDLTRLSDIYGYKRVKETLNRIRASVENSPGMKEKNILMLTLNLELEKLLYSHNYREAEKITKALSPLSRWLLIGPYSRYGPADLDYPFMPEIASSINETSENRKDIFIKNPAGSLNVGDYLYPRESTAYAISTIAVSGPVKLRVYCECPYILFVNGKKIIKNHREGIFRKCRVVRIWDTSEITVMIKLYRGSGNELRVIVTGDNDEVMEVKGRTDKFTLAGFKSEEVLLHPFDFFSKEIAVNPADAYYRLAVYFDELGSREALEYYRESLKKRNDPVVQYLFAYCMIDQSGGEKDSALYLEGSAIMDRLALEYPDFLPALYMRFRSLIRSRSYLEAYEKGRELLSAGNAHLPLLIDFSDLLGYLGYEKEFEEEINKTITKFPNSPDAFGLFAGYYKERNINRGIDLYEKCLDLEYRDRYLNELIGIRKEQGKYEEALALIKRHDYKDDFTREAIDINIDAGNFENAKSILLKELIESGDPYYNLKLGMISYLQGADPSMYWGRALRIAPSSFALSDFLRYTNTGNFNDPFAPYRERELSGRIMTWLKEDHEDISSRIIFRNMIYILNGDGGSRLFSEDLVYLGDQNALDRWGEYRVPFSGQFHPVRVRVYDKEGGFSDSYTIHKINGDRYITLASIEENSIAHVSYYVDNPIVSPHDSRFFSTEPLRIQNFNEGLSDFSLSVIAPEGMDLKFNFNKDFKLITENSGDTIIYSASLSSPEEMNREDFMGSPLNCLPYFEFSTMSDLSDFVIWYNGLCEGYPFVDVEIIKEKLKNPGVQDIIRRVYDYISAGIDITGDVLYYPESPENTLYNRKGTVEDRTHLAKAVLSGLGIRSYLAFARRGDLPDTGDFVSPHNFTDILLYVPLDVQKCLWLDFSSQYYQCGVVNEGVVDTDAIVIIGNSYEIKKIKEENRSCTHTNFEVRFDENGAAVLDIELEYRGRQAELRKNFKNKVYNEEVLNYYIGNIVPSISIDDYSIINLLKRERPFRIKARGKSFTLAAAGVNRITFQPVLKSSRVHSYIRYAERKQPLVIRDSIDERDIYTYILPSKFSSFELSKTHRLENEFGRAEIVIKKEKGSNELGVKKTVSIDKATISPDEYGKFLDFCVKLKDFENENITVK